ncbi:hypothetical protein FUA23_14570 [Neolewinella aurantiaca]|uniref:Uncharacterized protein n=1 Tax=Neolewinella aurantiaca TaxID=2602767 RepID=A0A5C7FCV6_9BACT|nr:hypothetical protein [Neolewinella aurantiaca]TXF88507.1 hypothetical protein FUA23_14570 [Neolewinella aurantiaca]
MTSESLIDILDGLRNGVDPRTGETFHKKDSCLGQPEVRRSLNSLIKTLTLPVDPEAINIPDQLVKETCAALRELGYAPCVAQLAKIFIGSRSIADHSLKGLVAYNKYRGVYKRELIHTHLMEFHRRFPEILPEIAKVNKRTVHEPWGEIDFFRVAVFDKMDIEKEAEVKKAIDGLGLRKENHRLPAYMQKARESYSRSFEPWVRDEQALLIEAMCYSNDLKRLSDIFGRSPRSLESMGQRLIFESKEKQRVA